MVDLIYKLSFKYGCKTYPGMSVTYSLCLSQTVFVCHRKCASVTDSVCPFRNGLWLSQIVCVHHRKSVSITDSLCLSQTVSFCHRQSVSVTYSLCMYQTLFLIILGLGFHLFIHDFDQYLFVRFEFVQDLGPDGSKFLDPAYRM